MTKTKLEDRIKVDIPIGGDLTVKKVGMETTRLPYTMTYDSSKHNTRYLAKVNDDIFLIFPHQLTSRQERVIVQSLVIPKILINFKNDGALVLT